MNNNFSGLMEGKYTIELRHIVNDPKNPLFNFDYEYIDESLKKDFEKTFIDHYYFNEIGFETIGRFKHALKSHLNDIMPYYIQLYKTELEAKNINFLLNKDLKETFIRDLTGDKTNNSKSNNINIGYDNSTSIQTNKFIESSLDNGIASIGDPTTANNSTNDIQNSTNIENKNNTDSTHKENNKEYEKTELISKGNIGVTSSGQLLKDWRDTILNIRLEIIESCYNLFMLIY